MHPNDEDKVRSERVAIESSELLDIPGVELQFTEEYQEGDFIIYNSWLGIVTETYDEVTVRLENDSVVVVEESADLDLDSTGWSDNGMARQQPIPVDYCYPGLRVSTKKGNLRRGRWKFGSYDPSVPPKGYVVDNRIIEIEVRWLTQNVLAPGDWDPVPRPPNLLDVDILESGKVISYNRGKCPARSSDARTELGFTAGSDIGVGDYVRFRDASGAAVKYDGTGKTQGSTPQGRFFRIPRVATLGYDMNVFQVTGTETQVSILWQDLSITQEVSANLLPYINVDDHDVWPGEIVALKESGWDESSTQPAPPRDVIRPQKVGVVQSVDAGERIARVRWLEDSAVEIAGETKSILIPGSRLGNLSDDIADLSFYEIVAYPALTKRRGDFVLVIPEQSASIGELSAEVTRITTAANQDVVTSMLASRPSDRSELVERGWLRTVLSSLRQLPLLQAQIFAASRQQTAVNEHSDSNPGMLLDRVLSNRPSVSHQDCPIDWFGEIVDLSLDGLLTIRLGALDNVRDMRVPLERIIVVMGGDDDDDNAAFSDLDEDEDALSEDGMLGDTQASRYDSEDVIEETYEYEGGERLDGDDGDEMWTTDDDDKTDGNSDIDPVELELASKPENVLSKAKGSVPKSGKEEKDRIGQSGHPTNGIPVDGPRLLEVPPGGRLLSTYPSTPPSFSILDTDPPPDHHFRTQRIHLTASGMRKIQKEHKILKSSLPDGIFVRTWESRLDLLRVLILGPCQTPYQQAPFIIDFQFGSGFPLFPPDAHFHAWTGGIGRINPNLYEDGKICLSLLGTWPADAKNEGWSPNRSSVLQILVSLMGLVLVKEPYYNEAGFDALIGTEESQITSAQYTERAFIMARGFVRHALLHPVGGFEDVVDWLYLPGKGERPLLLAAILEDAREIIRRSEARSNQGGEAVSTSFADSPSEGIRTISSGALILLRKHVVALENFLAKAEKGITAA